MHPIRQEVLSVGDDKVLRIWSLAKHVLVNQIDIPDKATCAVYKPDGHLIAVGLIKRPEDPLNPSTKGTGVAIVSYLQSKLQVVHVTSDCQQAVSSCLFTPDGKQLYVASKEGKIFVYDALDNFALTNTLTAITPCNCPEGCDGSTCGCGSASAPDIIEQLDVSSDSKIVVSYASSGKIRFWDNSDPLRNTPLSESKKQSFLASPSYFVRQGTSGLETLGIYKPDSVFGEASTVGLSKSSKLLICGDVFGAVRLYNASAKNLGAPHKTFTAHSAGGISKAAFSMQDEHVVTIGRCDRVMAVWRVVEDRQACSHSFNEPVVSYLPRALINSLSNVKLIEDDDGERATKGTFASSFEKNGVFFQPTSLETSCKSISASLSHIVGVGTNAVTKPLTDNVFLKHEMDATVLKIVTEEEASSNGEEGEVSSPSPSPSPSSISASKAAESKIKPFRYSSSFFSLPVARYCGTRDVVTSSGKVVSVIRRVDGVKSSVALPIPSNIQSSIFEDIGALATSPCARFIAVGTTHSWDCQASEADGFEGSVHVYQAVTYRPVSSITRQIRGGVVHTAFSQDASLLAVLGGDLEHTVHLFRSPSGSWSDAELLSKTPTSLSELSLVAFYSSPPSSPLAGKVVIAVGGVGGLFDLVTSVSSRNVVKVERFRTGSGVASRALGITAIASVPFGSALITGHEDGALLNWSVTTSTFASTSSSSHSEGVGGAVGSVVGKHNGPVSSLSAFFWDPNTEDGSSNAIYTTNSPSPAKSKVASKLRSSLLAKAGIISGSSDGIQAFSVVPYSEDNRCLTQVTSVSASTLSDASANHFVSGSAGRAAKLHDDREVFVTSISPDCKFNKVVVALSSSQIVELSLDSLACHHIAYGDTRIVRAIAPHPSNADIYATLTSDNSVNFWSVSTQGLIGQFAAPQDSKPLTATTIAFASQDLLLVGSGDRHAHHGHSAGSITAVKCDFLADCDSGVDNEGLAASSSSSSSSFFHRNLLRCYQRR
jgi:WD40 repeat protein